MAETLENMRNPLCDEIQGTTRPLRDVSDGFDAKLSRRELGVDPKASVLYVKLFDANLHICSEEGVSVLTEPRRDTLLCGNSRLCTVVLLLICATNFVAGCLNKPLADDCEPAANGVTVGINDFYLSERGDFRLDVPCYFLDVGYRPSPETNSFKVLQIPVGCKAVRMRGSLDLHELSANGDVECITLEQFNHESARDVLSFVSKFPRAKVMELSYGFPEELACQDEALDLRVFSEMRGLRHLDFSYYGCVSNSDAIIDNRRIDTLRISITRMLSDVNPNLRDDSLVDGVCTCASHGDFRDVKAEIVIEHPQNFDNGIRVLELDNANNTPFAVSNIPACCSGLFLKGKFDFTNVGVNTNIEWFSWISMDAACDEVKSIPYSRFPNLRSICLSLATEEECELDVRDMKVCRLLEHVVLSCDGNCIIRNIEEALANDRLWCVHFDFDMENRSRKGQP